MVERMQQKPDACMCGSTIRDFGNTAKIHALGGARYFRWLGVAWHIGRTLKGTALMDPQVVEQHMDYVVGASLLVRESYLREVGLMAEDYFLFFEEIDWFTRGRGRFSLAYAQDSIVYHRVGASVGTATNPRKKSYCCDYHTLRNRLKFTRRYYPRMLPGIYLVLAAEFLVRLVVGRWDLAAMVWHLLCSNEASQS
jgi:GT2 family glycosyltransferase